MEQNTKKIGGFPFIPYHHETFSSDEMILRSSSFFKWMDGRRTVRDFSNAPVPKAVIENILRSASTAPSGAHKQPWTFCAISDPKLKSQIRVAAEKEEYESYHGRMNEHWLEDLKSFQTDWHKPFLETAPWLIAVFRRIYETDAEGEKRNNYYVHESVGLACGFLLTAIHQAGLVALTHTPSPMNFLQSILQRPDNERPFLLIPVGYCAENTYVPDIKRKSLEEIVRFFE